MPSNDYDVQCSVSHVEGGLSDYAMELTEEELEALKEAVRSADGRKTEVKKAKIILGMFNE